MKITCEHCGCVIDTDKDKKCPNCGAPYSKNKEYSDVKDYKKKQSDFDLKERELDIHSKELQNKIVENTLNENNKAKPFIMVFFIIVFISIIAIISIFIFNFRSNNTSKENNSVDNKVQDIIDVLEDNDIINKKEEIVTIKYNENYSSDTFEIKCDGISNYKYDSFETNAKRGNKNYYNFHIVFKNKTNTWKTMHSINLTYTDDKGNEDVVAKLHSPNSEEVANSLDFFAKEKVTYTGNMAYEIPKYVKDVKIKYDNVIIEINDFKSNIK